MQKHFLKMIQAVIIHLIAFPIDVLLGTILMSVECEMNTILQLSRYSIDFFSLVQLGILFKIWVLG